MKIAFCHLEVSNLGDRVIGDTASYLVGRVLKDIGRDDIVVVPVDIGLEKATLGGRLRRGPVKTLVGLARCAVRAVRKYIPGEWFLRWQWRRLPAYRRYALCERPKLLDADLIVFAGGGLVKFHRQNYHFFVDDITSLAERKGTPVLFNAMGVEGYDASDKECRLLKRALNRSCVKAITTRDDIAMLRGSYVENPAIDVRAVCDPAFWTAETYGVRRQAKAPRTIGLNVIRPEIFQEYGHPVARDRFIELYGGVVSALVSDGWHVELFSNGVAGDSDFIEDLLSAHPEFRDMPLVSSAFPATAEEFVETIAGYDRFLAVRLHSAIVGTVLGVPNVSLVWNRKQVLFGAQVGMSENFIEREGFEPRNVAGRLMSAKPYAMDAGYKDTVLASLRDGLSRWLPERGGVHR